MAEALKNEQAPEDCRTERRASPNWKTADMATLNENERLCEADSSEVPCACNYRTVDPVTRICGRCGRPADKQLTNDTKGICCREGVRYQSETNAHGNDHPGPCVAYDEHDLRAKAREICLNHGLSPEFEDVIVDTIEPLLSAPRMDNPAFARGTPLYANLLREHDAWASIARDAQAQVVALGEIITDLRKQLEGYDSRSDYPRTVATPEVVEVLQMISASIERLAVERHKPDYDYDACVNMSNALVQIAEEVEARWPEAPRTANPTEMGPEQ